MSSLSDFASLFGAAASDVSSAASQTAATEQKVQEGIQTAEEVGTAWAGTSLILQAGTFFTLLYIAGRLSSAKSAQDVSAEKAFEEVEKAAEEIPEVVP